jgi:imidazolonepropionase-like amidohydrolase
LIEYAHARNKKAVVHIGSLIEMTTIARFKPDGFVHMWYSANDADLTEEKLKVIKESGAFIVPTARVNERALALVENEGPQYVAWARENFLSMDGLKEAIAKVHRAGITILAGTDNGNFDLNWGDDLINELILYQQSGMSNIEALKTATGNPARVWNIPVGFLNVGSRANMLLIDGNPLQDLNRLKQIETIWKNGRSD